MTTAHLLMEAVGRHLVTWTWQASIVVALGWMATLMDRAYRPALRQRIWILTLVCVLLTPGIPPLVASLSWTQDIRDLIAAAGPQPTDAAVSAEPIATFPDVAPSALRLETNSPVMDSLPNPPRNNAAVFEGIAVVWLAGLIIAVYLRLRALRSIRKQCANAESVSLQSLTEPGEDWTWLGKRAPRILLSSDGHSPMVVGWLRPAILAPGNLRAWSRDERAAVLRHESVHVRRGDQWASLLESLVRVLLFFHPPVRFACSRLSAEQEMSCDREVLRLGSDAETYAETILKVAERIVLLQATGDGVYFASKNLIERRIEMLFRKEPLKPRRSLLLFPALAMLTLLFALGLVRVQAQPALPMPAVSARLLAPPAEPAGKTAAPPVIQQAPANDSFEVLSLKPNKSGGPPSPTGLGAVKPGTPAGCHGTDGGSQSVGLGRCVFTNVTAGFLFSVISILDGQEYKLGDVPGWVTSTGFDIEGKASHPATQKELGVMLKNVLVEQFHSSFHRETRQVQGFALTATGNNPKLVRSGSQDSLTAKEANTSIDLLNLRTGQRAVASRMPPGEILAANSDKATLAGLASALSPFWSGPIVDATGLDGYFKFSLRWQVESDSPGIERTEPSLPTALEEQLGLKLVSRKVLQEYLIVDRIEKPSALTPAANLEAYAGPTGVPSGPAVNPRRMSASDILYKGILAELRGNVMMKTESAIIHTESAEINFNSWSIAVHGDSQWTFLPVRSKPDFNSDYLTNPRPVSDPDRFTAQEVSNQGDTMHFHGNVTIRMPGLMIRAEDADFTPSTATVVIHGDALASIMKALMEPGDNLGPLWIFP